MPAICKIEALREGGTLPFQHNGLPFFLVRKNGIAYAYRNLCPHIGIPLDKAAPDHGQHQFLDGEGELIQCSMHGALFVISTGACIYGPCNGKHLTAVKLTETDGWIHI